VRLSGQKDFHGESFTGKRLSFKAAIKRMDAKAITEADAKPFSVAMRSTAGKHICERE